MENLNPETISTATFLLTTMVIGAVELIKRISNKDWEATAIILTSALVGAIGGAFVLPVVGFAPGIFIGLSASGVVTGLQKIGGK